MQDNRIEVNVTRPTESAVIDIDPVEKLRLCKWSKITCEG